MDFEAAHCAHGRNAQKFGFISLHIIYKECNSNWSQRILFKEIPSTSIKRSMDLLFRIQLISAYFDVRCATRIDLLKGKMTQNIDTDILEDNRF